MSQSPRQPAPVAASPAADSSATASETLPATPAAGAEPLPRRGRGRPRKTEARPVTLPAHPPADAGPDRDLAPRGAVTQPSGRPPLALIPEGCPVDFPPEREWQPSGLVAAGGDLTPRRLVQAYSQGIFPWYSAETPILWWSPNPRCVLFPDELHIPRSLARTLRRGVFSFSINKAFIEVIRACAGVRRPGQRGTWITPSMIAAYLGLHRMGLAHSVECWQDGQLAGGLYGVALGRVFFGESMFHTRPDASKAALVTLIRCMRDQGFVLLDCQQTSPHMLRLGARDISRRCFQNMLDKHAQPDPESKGPSFRAVIPDAGPDAAPAAA